MELHKLAESLNDAATPGDRRMPKYLRLSEEIANAIDSGGLQVGDRLPGESELADALPASLGTVQKALATLVERGVVVRRHGLGTFVAERRMAEQDLWHFRFVADDGTTLLPVYTHVSAISKLGSDGPWAGVLSPDTSYVAIDRLIDINHEFTAMARLVVNGDRFSDLLDEVPRSFDGVSIRKVMSEKFGVPTLRFSTEVGVETLPEDAVALGLASGGIGLVCRIIGYGFRDAPVSYQTVCVSPNTRRLKFQD